MAKNQKSKGHSKEVREDPPQKVTKEFKALVEKYYPSSNGGKYVGKKKKNG